MVGWLNASSTDKDVLIQVFEASQFIKAPPPAKKGKEQGQGQSGGKASPKVPVDSRLSLLLVMAYDLLIGANKNIEGGGKVKKELMSVKVRMSAELTKLLVRAKASSPVALLPAHLQTQRTSFSTLLSLYFLKTSL